MATDTAIDVVMPQMGVSVSEGTILKWLKQEGESVEADEPLLEISTDKIDTEVPSPASGTVTQILVQEGETVDVGTKLAQIGGAAATGRRQRRPTSNPRLKRPSRPQRRRPSRRHRRPRPARRRPRRRRNRAHPPTTARRSSRRSWRGSRPSTASIRHRSQARAAAAA